jgi:hypothetical protein
MIITKKVTISANDLLNNLTNGITILPAPPTGKVNNIFGITGERPPGNTPYDSYQIFIKELNTSNLEVFVDYKILSGGGANFQSFPFEKMGPLPIFSATEDIILFAYSNLTGGNAPLDLFITYEELQITT